MVVDASVVVSNLVPHDVHHAASRAWLTRHIGDGGLVVAPALLLPEIAGAIYIYIDLYCGRLDPWPTTRHVGRRAAAGGCTGHRRRLAREPSVVAPDA
jgi:hypothetical protein